MDPVVLASSIVILLFSIILHEVMHGLSALYFGDTTAKRSGRLTLNPLPHIDPIGSILLPALFLISGTGMIFGWAKPVPVNPLNFNNLRLGELVVSLAGVASNLVLAILAAILFHLLGTSLFFPTLANVLSYTVQINLVLAVFNLLPVPPLDGSKVLMSILPTHLTESYQSLEKYGFLILLLLILTPVGRVIWLLLGLVINFLHFLLGV